MNWSEKVVIITGGASGIGLATALRFGSRHARVVIADLDLAKARNAAKMAKDAGATDAMGLACDVGDEAQVEATVRATLQGFGRLDVVVNNAGVMIFKPLVE